MDRISQKYSNWYIVSAFLLSSGPFVRLVLGSWGCCWMTRGYNDGSRGGSRWHRLSDYDLPPILIL
jgi:hypothetical protein